MKRLIGLAVLIAAVASTVASNTASQEVRGRIAFCERYIELFDIIQAVDRHRNIDEDYKGEKAYLVRQLLEMLFPGEGVDQYFREQVEPSWTSISASDLVELTDQQVVTERLATIQRIRATLQEALNLEEAQESDANFDPYQFHPILSYFSALDDQSIYALLDRWRAMGNLHAWNPMNAAGSERTAIVDMGQTYAAFLVGRPSFIPSPNSTTQLVVDMVLVKAIVSLFNGWNNFRALLSTRGDILDRARTSDANDLRLALLRLCFVIQVALPTSLSSEDRPFINWVASHLASEDKRPQGVRYAAAMVLFAIHFGGQLNPMLQVLQQLDGDGLTQEELQQYRNEPNALSPLRNIIVETLTVYAEENEISATATTTNGDFNLEALNYLDIVSALSLIISDNDNPPVSGALFGHLFILSSQYREFGEQIQEFLDTRPE